MFGILFVFLRLFPCVVREFFTWAIALCWIFVVVDVGGIQSKNKNPKAAINCVMLSGIGLIYGLLFGVLIIGCLLLLDLRRN